MLEAKHSAEETIFQAEQKAEQIKNNAVSANEQVTVSLNAMRREIKEVRIQLENIMKDFISRIDEIDCNLEKALSSADVEAEGTEKAEEDVYTSEDTAFSQPESEPEKEFFR